MNSDSSIFDLDSHFKSLVTFNCDTIYLSTLDWNKNMEMEIDLATIKHGKFKSGSEFKGNRIECNSISLYQNKCMLPKGKINIVVSDSFVKKLIEQRITVQKIYRLKFKIISDRIFEIEEMK